MDARLYIQSDCRGELDDIVAKLCTCFALLKGLERCSTSGSMKGEDTPMREQELKGPKPESTEWLVCLMPVQLNV